MFQREARQTPNQVSMLDSRLERQENEFFDSVRMPATVFHRSPLRERYSGSNNPSRQGTPTRKPNKDPSPVMSKRESTTVNTRSFLNSQTSQVPLIKTSKVARIQRDQVTQPGLKYCLNNNHDSKLATYLVSCDEGDVPYCEKCAILLASQGFKVCRVASTERSERDNNIKKSIEKSVETSVENMDMRNQALGQLQDSERRSQLSFFLNQIKNISNHLKERRARVREVLCINKASSKDLEKKVVGYFSELVKVMEVQKGLMLEKIEAERNRVCSESQEELKSVEEYIDDCGMMADDIFSSIEIIRHVDDKAFKKVMETYKSKNNLYTHIITKQLPLEVTSQNIDFGEFNKISTQLSELLKVRFKEPKCMQLSPLEKKVYFSFEREKMERSSKEVVGGKGDLQKDLDQKYLKQFDDSAEYDV